MICGSCVGKSYPNVWEGRDGKPFSASDEDAAYLDEMGDILYLDKPACGVLGHILSSRVIKVFEKPCGCSVGYIRSWLIIEPIKNLIS